MVFLLTLSVDNDAFTPEPYEETARILRAIADRLDTVQTTKGHSDYTDRQGGWTGHYQTILDANGNDVGRYAFKAEGK